MKEVVNTKHLDKLIKGVGKVLPKGSKEGVKSGMFKAPRRKR